MPQPSSGRPLRDLVAAADRHRRGRVAFARVQQAAPWLAGAALIVAAATRFFGGPVWSAGAILAAAALGLAAVWVFLRRRRPTTDAIALAVDTDAGLNGELRSAHWFEAQGERDVWAAFHLDHAAVQAGSVDWRALYPSPRSARSWMLTAVLAAGVIVTGFRLPPRHSSAQAAAVLDARTIGGELPADLKEKLARLIAQLDDAALDQDAKRVSLAELKKMMASMDPEMEKKLLAALDKKKADADAKASTDSANADSASAPNASTDIPDDLKWAQENQAARSAQADDRKPSSGDKAQPMKGGDPQSATMQAQADPNGKADAATPIVRDSAAADEGKKMMGGGGPMGGDSQPGAGKTDNNVKGAAQALLAAQALRKELLEASADALGDNVDKEDLRRKTEQGKSSLGFTHVTAQGKVDPSRSAAPPPVPEPRRSLLFHYFMHR